MVIDINAVDCVTQWQVLASVQTISEVHLLPVIGKRPANPTLPDHRTGLEPAA
jgi:hypothetical protein